MIRYGTVAKAMRPMAADDLLISRLKLLLIMAKAYLIGYPLGDFRKNAIVQNARYIFYQALLRADSPKGVSSDKQAPSDQTIKPHDLLFLHRVQLLAVMLNAFVEGKAKGTFRKKAMAGNIDHLGKFMADRFQISDAEFLKVA